MQHLSHVHTGIHAFSNSLLVNFQCNFHKYIAAQWSTMVKFGNLRVGIIYEYERKPYISQFHSKVTLQYESLLTLTSISN